MGRLGRFGVTVALVALLAACNDIPPIFEDVGDDPHPPSVTLLALGYTPPAVGEGEKPPPPAFQPITGFTVLPNHEIRKHVAMLVKFSDAGADVVSFELRDRDGSMQASMGPTAPADDPGGDAPGFFEGTGGEIILPDVVIKGTMAGEHRMEFWAEDSHGSRSPKVHFVLKFVL